MTMMNFVIALSYALSGAMVLADEPSSKLQIHIPQSMFKLEGYYHRKALFGFPSLGGSIAQNVFYADSDLCDPIVDTRKGYPIRSKDDSGNMSPWPTPYILLVDRGGCSFVQKVRNAQHSGASGVVIADNTCLCSDRDCVSANEEDMCQPSEPIMADDGSGADISIPSFLMFKVDADQLKVELHMNHMAQLEMQWSQKMNYRVEYELWTTPSDLFSKDFQKKFKPFAEALGVRAHFTPQMYIHDGIRSNCHGFDGKDSCFKLCTNNGRYCTINPENELGSGISGADLVKESLRRICIWKHYGEPDGIGTNWWDYVAQFLKSCDDPNYFATEYCVNDCYKYAKIEGDIIDRCMRDSGGLEKDTPNAFLDLNMYTQVSRGVHALPTLIVNGAVFHDSISVNTVFKAICDGYATENTPSICQACAECPELEECIANDFCSSKVIEWLQSNITKLEATMEQQDKEATEAIARCTTRYTELEDEIKGLEKQLAANDTGSTVADLNADLSALVKPGDMIYALVGLSVVISGLSAVISALNYIQWQRYKAEVAKGIHMPLG